MGRGLVLVALFVAAAIIAPPASAADRHPESLSANTDGRLHATVAQERPAKLVFVFSRPPSDPDTRWLNRLYAEALGRLRIAFESLAGDARARGKSEADALAGATAIAKTMLGQS